MGEKPTLPDLKDLVENVVLPFYQIERDMALPIPKRRMENDAEHSWSLALYGGALAPLIDPDLDVGKVCMFAIVHDLVEVWSGDTSVWGEQEELNTKDAREAQAMTELEKACSAFPWIVTTAQAYERQDSPEANFVKALDKVISLVIRWSDKGQFYHDIKLTQADFERKLESHRQKAHLHAGAAEYYEALRKIFAEHPEYFYQAPPDNKTA